MMRIAEVPTMFVAATFVSAIPAPTGRVVVKFVGVVHDVPH